MKNDIYLYPEWTELSAVQLTWPHQNTDWNYMLQEIEDCFIQIANEIIKRQNLIIVCPNPDLLKEKISTDNTSHRLLLVKAQSNDTWARDHGGISVNINGRKTVYDFTFNGWGLKFPANYDNLITQNLYKQHFFQKDIDLINMKNFVLEGGSIETDGKGTLLTTSECLLSPNRNSFLSKEEIESYLKEVFGLTRVLWLNHGYLSGDDTDSHIDTLARFCDENTIVYVKTEDREDEHYEALQNMEKELRTFTDFEGNPYRLIPLPLPDKIEFEGERLPATYANFLIIENTVLIPLYEANQIKNQIAIVQLQKAFPQKKIIGIDCTAIIKQHGSLHCVTMQYPAGFTQNS